MKNVNIFVYGVLMFAELRRAMTGRVFDSAPATLSDYRRYGVRSEQFPALLPQPGARTAGVLLFGVDPATVALFDLFEDVDVDLYRRHRVEVDTADGQRHPALAYVAGSAIAHDDLAGSWDPQQFEDHRLRLYIETVVSPFLQEIGRNRIYEQHQHR